MSTFGENLRREREMRGVSLEEIRDATKIGMRALKAMEDDQFEKLPGGIFTRSFIRTYAKYLGLDEEKIMAEFQLVAPRLVTPSRRVSSPRNSMRLLLRPVTYQGNAAEAGFSTRSRPLERGPGGFGEMESRGF